MDAPRFTWDPRKDAANQRKHGITFAEAETVFLDDDARLLIVVHCYRAADAEIRIISARRATRPESRQYAVRGG